MRKSINTIQNGIVARTIAAIPDGALCCARARMPWQPTKNSSPHTKPDEDQTTTQRADAHQHEGWHGLQAQRDRKVGRSPQQIDGGERADDQKSSGHPPLSICSIAAKISRQPLKGLLRSRELAREIRFRIYRKACA